MDDLYFFGAILGQYVLLIAIYRDISSAKEAIDTLKKWKDDAAGQLHQLELEHAINHGRTGSK